MEYRVISLPPFLAASSGVDREFDFSPAGKLGKFDAWFSAITPAPENGFMPRDFLLYDAAAGGMVWLWALEAGQDAGGFDTVSCPGGLYLTYAYRDGDEEDGSRLNEGALAFLRDNGFSMDEGNGRFSMGHIITPREAIDAGFPPQMETFLPIRIV